MVSLLSLVREFLSRNLISSYQKQIFQKVECWFRRRERLTFCLPGSVFRPDLTPATLFSFSEAVRLLPPVSSLDLSMLDIRPWLCVALLSVVAAASRFRWRWTVGLWLCVALSFVSTAVYPCWWLCWSGCVWRWPIDVSQFGEWMKMERRGE